MTRSWPLLALFVALASGLQGQGTVTTPGQPFTVHDAAEIAQHSQLLVEKARSSPDGFAAESWEKFGNSFTMLAARVRQGAAEVHVHTGDYIVVLQGHVTEVAGGTLVNGRESAPGELRGSAITGGTTRVLGPGDAVHIAGGTPHQTQMSGEPFVYLLIKVQE